MDKIEEFVLPYMGLRAQFAEQDGRIQMIACPGHFMRAIILEAKGGMGCTLESP